MQCIIRDVTYAVMATSEEVNIKTAVNYTAFRTSFSQEKLKNETVYVNSEV
jgi:hypothetical protein